MVSGVRKTGGPGLPSPRLTSLSIPYLSQLVSKSCTEVLSVEPSKVCIKGKSQRVTDLGKRCNSREYAL